MGISRAARPRTYDVLRVAGRLGPAGFSLTTWARVTQTDPQLQVGTRSPLFATARLSLAQAVSFRLISAPTNRHCATSWDSVRPYSAARVDDLLRLREARISVTLIPNTAP